MNDDPKEMTGRADDGSPEHPQNPKDDRLVMTLEAKGTLLDATAFTQALDGMCKALIHISKNQGARIVPVISKLESDSSGRFSVHLRFASWKKSATYGTEAQALKANTDAKPGAQSGAAREAPRHDQ